MHAGCVDPFFTYQEHLHGGAAAGLLWMICAALIAALATW